MKKGRRGAVLGDCLRKNRVAILLWVLTVLTEWAVFYLYRIMWEPLLYAGALTLAVGLLLLGLDLRREMQAARERLRHRLGRDPRLSELAEETGLTPEEIASVELATGAPESLQQETAEGLTLESTLGTDSPEERMVEHIAPCLATTPTSVSYTTRSTL